MTFQMLSNLVEAGCVLPRKNRFHEIVFSFKTLESLLFLLSVFEDIILQLFNIGLYFLG